MNFLKYEGKGYQPTYTRTELTDALHEGPPGSCIRHRSRHTAPPLRWHPRQCNRRPVLPHPRLLLHGLP